jgi:hypothetical protein
MREFLRNLENRDFHGLNFYRNQKGEISVDGFEFKNFGEKLPGSEMGELYDIIIFPDDPPKEPERFKAILSSPLHYISRMIDDGFLGIVAKATTTSDKFMGEIYEEMLENVSLYISKYEEKMNVTKV